ncbi:efflux RND transporter periplasmic adaptor subunit [Cognatilysobacter terrigena]|uniref:efflux RND transporter periplasmic adaptor subunit n=1 Tax=Cognatilysobacter terrigena TaxID=2488749 RepID=UPI00105B27A5|nr:efflux RND transporter periplasmic adaptor subunit [Lysobacter terrigena]
MNPRIKPLALAVAAFALVAAAVGAGYWWGHSNDTAGAMGDASGERRILYWYDPMVPQERYEKPGKSSMGMTLIPKYADPASGGGEREVLYWYDPMVPDQHFDKPGKSPFMDMALVPKHADGDAGADSGIRITPGVRQNLGMRTETVELGSLAGTVQAPGTVTWDLRKERVVSARVDSIVDRLYVRAPFDTVRAGQPLASVIAREWSTAIAEARALRGARTAAARSMGGAASERLRVLGMPAGARAGAGGTVTLTSPVSGVVSEIGVREGQFAGMGALLFRVNGTDTVWLEASVPQASVGDIVRGTPVTAMVTSMPGKTFNGRVEALLPQLDATSRTQKARIVLDNPGALLSPGMFAQVTIRPVDGVEVPLVPTDALVGNGTNARVIVLGTGERFKPVLVRTGRSSGGKTEILEGLRGGERVVVSGQFLIDSEANLSGALTRLGVGAPNEPAAPKQSGSAMPNAAPAAPPKSPAATEARR